MTADFNLLIKVRNARLLQRMRECGFANSAQLAAALGVWPTQTGSLISMKTSPINRLTGNYTNLALQVCEILNVSPVDLWPQRLLEYEPPKHAAEVEISEQQLLEITGNVESSEDIAVRGDMVQRLIADLTPRIADVITRRFGIGAPAETLEEVAESLGVGRERIRQLEYKGLSKMAEKAKTMGRLPI